MISVTTGKSDPAPRVLEQPQAFVLHSLERVGRGARLERAAAQQMRAGALDRVGGRLDLLLALDRAGAGDNGEALAADLDAVDVDQRALGTDFAAGELERLHHRHHAFDAARPIRDGRADASPRSSPTHATTVRSTPRMTWAR